MFSIISSNQRRQPAEALLASAPPFLLHTRAAASIAVLVSAAPSFGTRPMISPVAGLFTIDRILGVGFDPGIAHESSLAKQRRVFQIMSSPSSKNLQNLYNFFRRFDNHMIAFTDPPRLLS